MSDSNPGRGTPGRALIYSLIGFALLVAILWGILSGSAFPLIDSTGIAGGGFWACPVGLLAGVVSLVGVVTGFVALGELGAKGPPEARGKAWSAVLLGGVVLAALVALMTYFVNRGLMH